MMPMAGETTAMGATKTIFRCAVCPTEVDSIAKAGKHQSRKGPVA
jgi:hypothetical protein